MRALSLWQPHAIAIGLGLKLYETRDWQLRPADIGVPVAIHAAKKEFRERDYPWEYFKQVRDRLRAAGQLLHELDYGKVICIATFSACIRTTSAIQIQLGEAPIPLMADLPNSLFWGDFSDVDEFGKQRWAFKIENVRLIPKMQRPEITGRQGFFEVPNEIGLWGL